MQKQLVIFFSVIILFIGGALQAQVIIKDSVTTVKSNGETVVEKTQIDTTTPAKPVKKFNPRTATIRSAIFPGLGQIYNKKYWKLPLVYGSLGITGAVFVYNIKNYRLLKLAYILKSDSLPSNDSQIDPRFQTLSLGSIRTYRNAFRQNVDYSVIFFLAFWALNVVDATVDAHLKGFDVNDNLSLHFSPGYSNMANTAGLSLVLDIHPSKYKSSR